MRFEDLFSTPHARDMLSLGYRDRGQVHLNTIRPRTLPSPFGTEEERSFQGYPLFPLKKSQRWPIRVESNGQKAFDTVTWHA